MLQVRVAGQDAGRETRSLRLWLDGEADIRRAGGVRPVQVAPEPGTMGPLDVVDLVLSNGVSLATLVWAVATWRATRPPTTSVMIRRGDIEVTITTDDADAVARIVDTLDQGSGDP